MKPEARFIRADYADALERLRDEGVQADIIYLDLGISSLQLDAAERGFSYSYDAPLDMRMDPEGRPSAADLVNEWPEERLATVIREYGEERHARSIAREITRRRPLNTTAELVDAIRAAVPPAYRFGRGHPAKRTFQALRIAVNDELVGLLPLARGPSREGLSRRPGAGLHLSAGASRLRLRQGARGRTAHAARPRCHARGG